jgi:hypothetical protein
MTQATKTSIRATYLKLLSETYPFYTPGSQEVKLAAIAADSALKGRLNLKGDCWDAALMAHGLDKPTLGELEGLAE